MHAKLSLFRTLLLGAGTAAALAPAVVVAQINDSIRGRPSEANHFIETPRGWRHPRTPWGEPDIRANLNMMQAAGVPLERCANSYRPGFGQTPMQYLDNPQQCDMNKAWLTEEEFRARWEAFENQTDRYEAAIQAGNIGAAIQAAVTDPSIPQRQTNLIVDPPNGLLPEILPQAKRRALEMGSDWALPGEDIVFETVDDFDSWDRCITRGMPSMMMPYRYNGGLRIMQAPGYVILNIEMIHEARVIPTDGRPQLDDGIRQYLGESRGRWEGTTLVIETTNYRVDPWINQPLINLAVVGSPPGNRFPISDKLKTTERIIRLNDEWWLYEITTEDPEVLSRPFTVRYPMRHDPAYWWSEYACHEDNTIVRNYVTTNRYERANPTPEPPQPPVEVAPSVADALAGRWVGRPRIPTIDVDIELEFIENPDGTVNAKLIGTNLGKIDKPLRNFMIEGRKLAFQLPNIQPWDVAVKLTDDGTLEGVVYSIQGGVPVTFRRTSGGGSSG